MLKTPHTPHLKANNHVRNLFLLLLLLSLCAGGSYLLFISTHNELLIHLTAVFIEVFFSVLIVDLYLEHSKRRDSFHIYSLARNYIFERMFMRFNEVFSQSLTDTTFIEILGRSPSFHSSMVKGQVFNQVANHILQNMSDESIIKVGQIIEDNFEKIEKHTNLSILYQNEDLITSIIRYVDLAFVIKNIKDQGISDEDLLDAVRNNKTVLHQSVSLQDTYVHLIETWLYIINNFIYFTETPSHIIRQKFLSYTKHIQHRFHKSKNRVS